VLWASAVFDADEDSTSGDCPVKRLGKANEAVEEDKTSSVGE
jgi:hypothetical protein